MIVQQHEDREAAADAIEYAIKNVETPEHAEHLRRVVAEVMAKLDAKMPPPITCAACNSGPRNTHRGRLCACASVDAKLRAQAWEIEKLLALVKEKNLQLDALHFVWCDGACESGTHRHGGELTQAVVDEAERNTERLKRRWAGLQRKAHGPSASYEAGLAEALAAYHAGERGMPWEEYAAGRNAMAESNKKP